MVLKPFHSSWGDDITLKICFASCAEVEHAKILVDSISHKSKLVNINLSGPDGRNTSGGKWLSSIEPNLQKLVCNVSTFGSLCQSYHHLSFIREKEEGGECH